MKKLICAFMCLVAFCVMGPGSLAEYVQYEVTDFGNTAPEFGNAFPETGNFPPEAEYGVAEPETGNTDPERYFLQVDFTNQVVTAYERDQFGQYTLAVRQMICSSGAKKTPSPSGTFKMGAGRVRFGYFTKYKCYAQYWSQLTRNIYFHSVLYSQKDTKTLIKSSYRNLGKAVSHGCIRLLPEDAQWIYENICEGTTVNLTHKLPKNAALTKALKP